MKYIVYANDKYMKSFSTYKEAIDCVECLKHLGYTKIEIFEASKCFIALTSYTIIDSAINSST